MDSKNYRILSRLNNKALCTSNSSNKNTRDYIVVRDPYTQHLPNQFFYFQKRVDGSYLIRCRGSDSKVLDVCGESKKEAANILSYEYHGKANQVWKVLPVIEQGKDTGYVIFENMLSKLVMEIHGGLDHEGVEVVQNRYYKNRNQEWKIESEDGKPFLISGDSNTPVLSKTASSGTEGVVGQMGYTSQIKMMKSDPGQNNSKLFPF